MFRLSTASLLTSLVAVGCTADHGVPNPGRATANDLATRASVIADLAGTPAVDLGIPNTFVATADMRPGPDMRHPLPAGKLFFVTHAAYPGDILDQATGSTGLAVADNLCTSSATAAGLHGTWRAWLSDRTTRAIDRIADVGPWYLLDGSMVFANKANFMTAPMVKPIIDETGAVIPDMYVWTGYGATGYGPGDYDCNDWGGGATTGDVGNPSVKAQWQLITTGSDQLDCGSTAHLYCIEQ
jgi:hypothetical protein